MRTCAIAVAVLALVSGVVCGQTYVSGDINTNTTWDYAGSPYIVVGLTEVVDNSILTIEPGVTVAFDGFYLLRVWTGSSIYAVGATDNRIRFTSNAGTPAPDDWIAVRVLDSAASEFSYCDFEYSRWGLVLVRSSPSVSHCSFSYNNSYAMECEDSSPAVDACDFHDNDTAMHLDCNSGVTQPTVHGCNFEDNAQYNVYLTGYDDPPLVTIDAENNWWGTAVESEIEAGIEHDVDNATIYGHVDYDPWLTETPVHSTSWGLIKALFVE